jgi:hypothetical protein
MRFIEQKFFLALISIIFCLSLTSCRIAPKVRQTLLVPDEIPSLEKAIEYAASGDTIVVFPGRYQISTAGLRISQQSLTIMSAQGAEKTILMGTGENSTISFGQDSQATLRGFTITTAHAPPTRTPPLRGGGIYCAPSSAPMIIDNIIIDNCARFGGGIYCSILSSPSIVRNIIRSNHAWISGGGIFSFRSSPRILNNRIIQNSSDISGGGLFCNADHAVIQNNIFAENQASHFGGGCSLIDSTATSANNTISLNIALFGGGIFSISGKFQVSNTILWKNRDDLCLIDINMISRPRFSNIEDRDYLGINGNISQDPLFVDPNHRDYQLRPESPCHNAGDPQEAFNNPDGSQNTMGAYGGPHALPQEATSTEKQGGS